MVGRLRVGGLVSPMAVTLSLARRSRDMPGAADAMAVGVPLSWDFMPGRVVIEVMVLAPPLLSVLAALMVSMFAVSLAHRSWPESYLDAVAALAGAPQCGAS